MNPCTTVVTTTTTTTTTATTATKSGRFTHSGSALTRPTLPVVPLCWCIWKTMSQKRLTPVTPALSRLTRFTRGHPKNSFATHASSPSHQSMSRLFQHGEQFRNTWHEALRAGGANDGSLSSTTLGYVAPSVRIVVGNNLSLVKMWKEERETFLDEWGRKF